MAARSKVLVTRQQPQKPDAKRPLSDSLESAMKLIDDLTTPTINFDEERPKDSLSAPDRPASLSDLSVAEVRQVLNTQLPREVEETDIRGGMVMQLYRVVDRFGDQYADPFSRRDLAEKLLSIVLKADDDEAEIQIIESDPYAAQLSAGLQPFRIGVELWPATGKVRETKVWPAWPPAEQEGRISEAETYIEYFAWARSSSEALRKLARFSRPAPTRSRPASEKATVEDW